MDTHYHALITASAYSLAEARDRRLPDAGEHFAYPNATRAARAAHDIAQIMGLGHWGVFDCQRPMCRIEAPVD